MADEKKEETVENKGAPKEAEAIKPTQEVPKEAQAPQPAPAAPAPEAPAASVKEEKKEAVPIAEERPANCAGCKKSIRKRWYYRNGKYYCTKRCWDATTKKSADKKEEPAAS